MKVRAIHPTFSLKLSLLAMMMLCLAAAPTQAQKNILKSNQVWLHSYHEGRISEKWTILLDGGFRWRNGVEDKLAYIVRTGAGYSISPRLRLGGGFANLGVYAGNSVVRREYRPYQELLFKDQLGKLNLSHRLRVEERFFKDLALDFATVDFNFRFRYAFSVGIPLARLSKKDPQRKIILNLGDEIFINAGKEIGHSIFDQNRLILSPTLQWNKALSVSFTYNSQFAGTPQPETYLKSHIAWLQIRHNLDFSH
jgi:hypothetical protein